MPVTPTLVPVTPIAPVMPNAPKISVTPIPSISPVPSATPVPSVTPPSLLDGSAQFTVLALLLGVVVYIRNIPAKELSDGRKKWDTYSPLDTDIQEKEKKSKKLRNIYFQAITLDIFQIVLVGLSVAIAGRSVLWGAALDNIILWLLLVFALLFLAFHVWINGGNIINAINAWKKL